MKAAQIAAGEQKRRAGVDLKFTPKIAFEIHALW
jgi:hypothetical protein